ncbi:alpha/beta fold hydrolase [Actinomadura madurae]|uniref:Pyochelin biosynthetic protein PchC n=1 Tax=Actinomadura madurae TaxID=1993 RepID=A0A1I5PBW5_9ACTN|nr:alpha/beta fold hydrolase [Actinomadura madurae]SFP31270.1 pyochelin biosynthetic protein PchC [Actinomadura madurae]SPT63865.1 Linear gramicidin dehydrogenase LgrE [Actinomadura madurae]
MTGTEPGGQDDRWLRIYRPRPDAALRLVLLPHAGGSASFYRFWPGLMPDSVEVVAVQYPGREDRLGDPRIDDMDDLATALTGVISRQVRAPYALFGHSLGAAVAYETARRLEDSGPGPVHLLASGRHAPQDFRHEDVHLRDDDALVAELTRLGGTAAVLLSEPALREMVVPILRNDYRLAETYRCADPRPLRCPITAVIGERDPEVTRAEARRWEHLTRAAFKLWVLPGGHFYLSTERHAAVDRVLHALGLAETPTWPSTP